MHGEDRDTEDAPSLKPGQEHGQRCLGEGTGDLLEALAREMLGQPQDTNPSLQMWGH